MKKLCKHLLMLAVILCCIAGLAVNTQAAETVASGACGENVTWTLDSDGVLIISGTGDMTDYTDKQYAPWYDYRLSVNSINIDEGVTNIGEYTFQYCDNVTAVSISNTVSSIGTFAFYNCDKLASVDIPDSVRSIGYYAFGRCSGLTQVHIGNGLISIGTYAFSWCSSLAYLDLGNSITTVGNSAFAECVALTNVVIPQSVRTIGETAFGNCSELINLTIENGVLNIGKSAFQHCRKLTTVNIPDSVLEVGAKAFYDCKALKELSLGNSLKQIGAYAFYNCKKIESITFPDSVQVINGAAFADCSSLYTILFMGNAPTIKSEAFRDTVITAYYPANDNTWTEEIRNNYGGIISWSAYVCLQITVEPVDRTVKDGAIAKFTVEATGNELTYQWQYRTSSSGSWKNVSAASGKTASYSLTAQTHHSGYRYRCVVTDGEGNKVYSNAVNLYVLGIKTQPVSKTVVDGGTAKFTVAATGKGLTYQWQYRTSSSGSWKNASATGNKTNTLSVAATVAKHGYQYRCKVTDSAGNTVYTSVVNLYVLGIKTQPASRTVKAGATAKFTVAATGKGLTYQWQYRTSSSGSWKNASATGNKTNTLSVAATVAKHGYQYRCKVTDSAGNKVYTKTVTLNVLGIKTQPVSKTVVDGGTAKFTVAATGKGLTYQWQYRTSSSGSWKNASATGNKTNTLSVAATVAKHGYQYRCKVTDSAGNTVYTSVVNLYVLGIKTQPASRTVKAGATAKFTVAATGRGLTFQWQYRTSSSGSWKNVSVASGKTANYSLTAAARHNGYQYRCKITDSAGNVIYTKTVKLTVK